MIGGVRKAGEDLKKDYEERRKGWDFKINYPPTFLTPNFGQSSLNSFFYTTSFDNK